jgi:DNA-binding NtrC family response regulator
VEDISFLADYFIARFAGEMGIDNPGIEKEAKALLKNHPWQGNVRELSNSIQKTLIFSRGNPISAADISKVLRSEGVVVERDEVVEEIIGQWIRNVLISGKTKDMFHVVMDRFARKVIIEVLKFTDGNRSRAAEVLGISRPTLLSKIEKYQIETKTSVKGTSS